MACSRASAARRLTALYLDRLLADENFRLCVSLSDALCEENIETVRKLDLYSEYDRPPVAAVLHDYDRNMTLLPAWLSPPQGRLQ
jgi:hypothetical protein